MSRFPKVSETFVIGEAAELVRQGWDVRLFPLHRERAPVPHSAVAALLSRCRFAPLFSWRLVRAQLEWIVRRPGAYASTWAIALWESRRSPGFLVRTLIVIPKAVAFASDARRLGITHLHAHFATHPALAAWAASRLTGIPYSFTAHAHDIYVDRTMLPRKASDAAFVVTISDHNARLLAESGCADRGKISVIRCGVARDWLQAGPADPAPSRLLRIACIASLEPYKGHEHLIAALSELQHRGVPFRATLVGRGPLRTQLERSVRSAGLEQSVNLVGAKGSDEVRDLLAASDVSVLASVVMDSGKKEGIPVALMESLALGVPVVATDISGVAELVADGEDGLLVPERDPVALADALMRLAGDPGAAREMGRAGRRKVAAEYALERNVARLGSLIAGRRGDDEPAPDAEELAHAA